MLTSLDQLRTFVLVVETGSFSSAAQHLELSQPAVSLQIKELERRLSARLIERVGRRAVATPAGATLLGYARKILDLSDEAADAVTGTAEGLHGTVRLGTGATACLHFFPPLLRRLRREHPDLQVMVSTGNTADLVRKVELNELDFGLVTLPAAGRALNIEPVLQDPFVLIAPASDDLPATVSAKLLGQLPLIQFEPGANTRRLVDDWLSPRGGGRPVMELGSVETIKEMVRAGLGYSVIPQMAMRTQGDRGLQVRPLSPALTRSLGLVMRQDKPLTRGMQTLIQAIRQSAGAATRAA